VNNKNADPTFTVMPIASTSVSDAEIEALLRLSFVAGGFTDRSDADSVFKAAEVKARGDVLVAIDEQRKLIGMAIAVPVGSRARHFAEAGDAELQLLCVRPDQRDRGVGSALVQAVVQAARRGSARRLLLWTQPLMESAQRLYRRQGFQRKPAMDFSRGSRTFVVFVRSLSERAEDRRLADSGDVSRNV
jgi:GNAT superfamily N-acetyltransferase